MEKWEAKMKFYADENFPRPVVTALRALNHDVLTAHEDGRANQKIPDEEVLRRSTELGRAVLSMNRRDFARLHQTQPNHAGIVLCKYETDFEGQASRIHGATTKLKVLSEQLIRVQRASEQKVE